MRPSPRGAIGLALLLLVPAGAQAQRSDLFGDQAPEAAAPDTVGNVRPIPPAQVGREAEALDRRLTSMRGLLVMDPGILDVQDRVPGARAEVESLVVRTAVVIVPPVDRRDVTDATLDWRRAQGTISASLQRVRRRLAGLGEAAEQLAEWEVRWAVTDSAAVRTGAGPELRARIAGARTDIARADEAINQRLDAIIQLEAEHSAAAAQAATAIATLSGALNQLRTQAGERNAAPLWSLDRASGPEAGVGARLDREMSRIEATFLRHRSRLAIHLLGTALLVWLLTRASRAVSREEGRDAEAAATARVLAHPVNAALLVSFMLTFWIYRYAPMAVRDLVLILATVPLVLLTPTLLAPSLARPVMGLALVHLLARVDSALLGEGALHRFALLAVSLGGCAVLWRALSQHALRQAIASPRWGMALRRVGQLALGFMALGVVANLFGFLTLAEFVAEGVPLVFYLAVVLAVFVRVLDGLFVLLLDGWGRQYLRSVERHRAVPRRAGWLFLQALGILTWLVAALWAFSLLEPVKAMLVRVFSAGISVGSVDISVGDVAIFAFSIGLAVLVAKMLSGFIEEDILGRMQLERGVAPAIARLARYGLITIGVIIALAAAGVQLTSLAIVGGALGVGIGFGLQNIVANFVAGLILAFERPIKGGDLIQVGDLTGTVRGIGIRASVVHTFEGAEVIVPNSDLVSRQVVNWTFTDPMRRMEIPVGVAYGSDVRAVMQLVREVADRHPDVLASPPPQALFRGLGDSSLDFALRAWTERFDQWFVVESELLTEIHDRLNQAGIVIPFPQRDLHLKSISELAAQHLATEGPPRSPTTPPDREA